MNLHFDYDGTECRIRVERGETATVRCRPNMPCDVIIRVPGWAPRDSVQGTVDGQPCPVIPIGDSQQLCATDVAAGSEIVLTYARPKRTSVETMPVSGKDYHLEWIGDQPVSVHPYDDPCCLYA